MTQKTFNQIIRFILIGVLNTLVDFAVFNLLIFLFGVHSSTYIIFKSLAFCVAIVNSYIWNSAFVFKTNDATRPRLKEQKLFLLVTLIGLSINTLISFYAFLGLNSIFPELSPTLSANLGALLGTSVVLFFNFTGYKFFVFKDKTEEK